ncbi:DUF397 domain-containing protein [Streptomyces sp. ME01-24h]|nr:DUF397 domain-containing protein [Streptomyces sp. ME19-03-3]MDX3355261.1 DUF397 domain-containing protein [Streptomyces sp. ME01-24h]
MSDALPRYVTSSTSLIGVDWRHSSHSTAANNCVETALVGDGPLSGLLAVRDSKDVRGPALLFPPAAWAAFLAAVRAGSLTHRP